MDNLDLKTYLNRICQSSSQTLKVKRVSVWFYNETNNVIDCKAEYHDPSEKPLHLKRLETGNHSNYFKASRNLRTISAYDAMKDPLTYEFAESYLKPLGIVSMMDVPIWMRGATVGIVCFEHIGELRQWETEEQNFASAIAELISRAIEIDRSKEKEAVFKESQRFLSTLISNLPGYVYRCSSRDNQWFVEFASEGIYELTGYRAEEMLKDSHKYSSLVHIDDKNAQADVVLDALKNKKPYQITYRIITAAGVQKWVWEQGRGVYSSDGNLVATEGFITDITGKKQVEDELIKRNNELSTLNRIGQTLNKLAEPVEIMDTLLSAIGSLFDASNIYVALYDEERELISFPLYLIDGKPEKKATRLFGNGITEYVIRNKRPVMINSDIEISLSELEIEPMGKICKSIVSAPMLAGDKVIGVITIQDYKNEFKYSESQIEILSTIASQASIAIQNASLYNEVKKSLSEKEILLQEVHHRVKNNLQIMSSLVKLQSHHIKDENTLEILKESENRIRSMAIVHNKLYNTKDYVNIDFGDYVKSLTESFYMTYGMRLNKIKFEIDIKNIILNIDTAIPCGLIINELVSNSIKYAYPNHEEGIISISMGMGINENELYTLVVKDNGIGLPAGFDAGSSKTLGIELVTLLTNQLNGKLEIRNENGAEFKIVFEESVYKNRH